MGDGANLTGVEALGGVETLTGVEALGGVETLTGVEALGGVAAFGSISGCFFLKASANRFYRGA